MRNALYLTALAVIVAMFAGLVLMPAEDADSGSTSSSEHVVNIEVSNGSIMIYVKQPLLGVEYPINVAPTSSWQLTVDDGATFTSTDNVLNFSNGYVVRIVPQDYMSFNGWEPRSGTISKDMKIGGAFTPVTPSSVGFTGPIYGSNNVGAKWVIFDANGGNGGFAQYVLPGNAIYCPTEYKYYDLSNQTYTKFSKSGYVLLGWSENKNATIPTYVVGESLLVSSNKILYAVWETVNYNNGYRDTAAEKILIYKGQELSKSISYNSDPFDLMVELYGAKLTLTFSKSGIDYPKQEMTNFNGGLKTVRGNLNSNWITFAFTYNGDHVTITGTPSETGTYEAELEYSSANGYTFVYKCYFEVVDKDKDPSNIYHVTYGETSVAHGPYMTAVKLPDAGDKGYLKGWKVSVNNSMATFPCGGSYSIERALTLVEDVYTSNEIINSQVVGLVAYNANGGHYEHEFAALVPRDVGYVALAGTDIVSKGSSIMLGWNKTGSATDPIYPAGYLYNFSSAYTELKAVWVDVASNYVTVYLENPGNGSQNSEYRLASGYTYVLPENGFEIAGYTFVGWSDVSYPVGEGAVTIPSNTIVPYATKTYYSVYEPTVYNFTIRYHPAGPAGEVVIREGSSTVVPSQMIIEGPFFEYGGYDFIGWSDVGVYQETANYSIGDVRTFTQTETITLYAVWKVKSEAPEEGEHQFILNFNGNGSSVSNMPGTIVQTSTEDRLTITLYYVPIRTGFDFYGWAETPNGLASYTYGEQITLEIPAGQNSVEKTLYAVWTDSNTGVEPGNSYVATFVGQNGTLRTVLVPSGNRVTPIAPPSVEGRAFLGWSQGTSLWDFNNPVTDNLTLTAKYLVIFDLKVEGHTLKPILKVTASETEVTYSDGHIDHVYSSILPTHDVQPNTTGSVIVKVHTNSGTYTSMMHYAISEEETPAPVGTDIPPAMLVVIGIFVLIGAIIVRRFVL